MVLLGCVLCSLDLTDLRSTVFGGGITCQRLKKGYYVLVPEARKCQQVAIG